MAFSIICYQENISTQKLYFPQHFGIS